MSELPDVNELEIIAREAIAGELPVLTEDLGHELLEVIEALTAKKKIFDTTLYSNVLLMDVEYEGSEFCPHLDEKLVLSFTCPVMKATRQVKIYAAHAIMLMDLIRDAIPEDGV